MSEKTAIVIGSGIAGMTAAYRLHDAGFRVLVLEAENIVGGRMSCHRQDGFTFNRASTALGGGYDFLKEFTEEIGLDSHLKYSDFKIGTFRNGRIYTIRTNHIIRDSLFSGLLTLPSKLLMTRVVNDTKRARNFLDFADLSLAAPIDNETVADYAKRRLNKELLDYVVDPTMAAVLATTPTKASIVDFLFSVANYTGKGIYRFDGGIDFLIKEISKHVQVETNARALSVKKDRNGVEVRWDAYGKTKSEAVDGCVIAVSAHQVPKIYPELDVVQRDILDSYEYRNIIACQFGLRIDPDVDAAYVLIPQCEIPGLIIVLFPHRMSGNITPPGKGIVTACSNHEWANEHMDATDEQIVEAMLPMVERVMPDIRQHIEVSNVCRWAPALFSSKPGSYKKMAQFKQHINPLSPIQLAGDYFAFSSTNSSASSGDIAARRIIDAADKKDNRRDSLMHSRVTLV